MMQECMGKRILVTGATGFIGRALCKRLLESGFIVKGTLLASESLSLLVAGVEPAFVEPLGEQASYQNCLNSIDTIIHLAARVHIMRESAHNPLYEFHNINTLGTLNLASQAAGAGVKRFVFMSTIGVNGDNSGEKPYTEIDVPQPHNPYSVSKLEAEIGLKALVSDTSMEVVIIRSPLVYGPGNPGNFLSLLKFVSKGIPLPLSTIKNKRSLIYVGNLVDAIAVCAEHPSAAKKTYLVSDGKDVSTPELIHSTALALGVPARLFPFPLSLMKLVGKLLGKSSTVDRLLGSLTLDSSKIRKELGWVPPFTMEYGLNETAKWYNEQTDKLLGHVGK